MGKIQKKWRDSLVNVEKIEFKKIKFKKIISYPPAGNDVFDCIGIYNGKEIDFIFKSERGKFANFSNEIKVLNIVKKFFLVPKVLESGIINNHMYIVMTKLEGDKLSELFKEKKNINKNSYLFNYGKALGEIHKLNISWDKARIRDINNYPKQSTYGNFEKWEEKVINYLKKNNPKKQNYNTFIHGDFHYGNILWNDYKITGILDWEYSGIGLKEQDIAWALILRPEQEFMDNKEDIKCFLEGYKSTNTYDEKLLKWCYINGTMHFYLMNKNNKNETYLKKLKFIIDTLI